MLCDYYCPSYLVGVVRLLVISGGMRPKISARNTTKIGNVSERLDAPHFTLAIQFTH